MKTNITYIVSNINKSIAFEWISSNLNKDKFHLNFILLNSSDSELENYLKENNITVDRITYSGKKDIPGVIFKIYKILKKHKTSIVHAHLFDASIAGLTAAWLARIPERIHTRHHSNYHHIYHPSAVKYDKYVNLLSTKIIAISEVVKDVLISCENAPTKKIHLIHHGFKLADFVSTSLSAKEKLLHKYNPKNNRPVIGVISRYTEWKGIQYIIPAFNRLLTDYPNALLVLANANGDYKQEIQDQLKSIPSENFIEIPFETDIFSLYKLFDVFVHVPITAQIEAFGQTYIEALAAGIPSVFTLSGISNEFIVNDHNALVVPYQNPNEIYTAIEKLLTNKELAQKISSNGRTDVNKLFGLDKMILSLESLYKGQD